MTRRLALAGAVLAFALAALLGVLAADVLRTDRALAAGDARFARVAGPEGIWDADTVLAGGASRALLGVGDDLEFRAAVQRFRLARPREPVTRFAQLTRRNGAERVLARTDRAEEERARRSIVVNLRGALAMEEAKLGTNPGPPLRRAAGHFRRALELDPANRDAQFNLELVLRLIERGAGSSAGSGGRAGTPASGSGSATAGRGY